MQCEPASGCKKRWAGDEATWAATEYQERNNPSKAAPWYKRCVTDGEEFTTLFTVAAQELLSCVPCTAQFTGDSQHTVRVTLHGSWQGISDVLQMAIIGGGGHGESYFYAKGRGWVGFSAGATAHHSVGTDGSNLVAKDPCKAVPVRQRLPLANAIRPQASGQCLQCKHWTHMSLPLVLATCGQGPAGRWPRRNGLLLHTIFFSPGHVRGRSSIRSAAPEESVLGAGRSLPPSPDGEIGT